MIKRKKKHYDADYGRGWIAGYTEYRYGTPRPITLAGRPKAKPIFRGEKKRSLIDETMDVLKDWRSSPFENEGTVRAGMRSALCMEGHQWPRSDAAAEEIVATALSIMGAERPSFAEAQRGYPNASDYCHWCFSPMDEEDRSRNQRFCGTECAHAGLKHMARERTGYHGAVLRSAVRLITREQADPRPCEFCGTSFRSDSEDQRFCSSRCAGLLQAGDRAYQDRQCLMCHTPFRQTNADQRCCSLSCAARFNRREEALRLAGERRNCAHCEKTFQPTAQHAIYCSPVCTARAGSAAFRERNRPAPQPPVPCRWCGDVYQPKIKLRNGVPGFCSTGCNRDADRFGKGDVPRDLTRRTFDHFFTAPADAAFHNRLTPQRFDWMLMEQGMRITGQVRVAA